MTTKLNDKNGVILNLKLDQLQLKDAGQVKVKASNWLGDVSSTALLTVKGKLQVFFF